MKPIAIAAAMLIAATAHAGGLDRHRRTGFGAGAAGFTRGLWDLDTGVPLQLYGSGLSIPGAARAPARAARAVLERHIDLLAPGSGPGDLVLLVDRAGPAGAHTVAFAQRAGGLPVLGARVSFRFRGDRLVAIASTALPHPVAAIPTAMAPPRINARRLK